MDTRSTLVARSLAGMMLRDKLLMLWTGVLLTSVLLLFVGNAYAARGGFVLWSVAIAFAIIGVPNFLQESRDAYFKRADEQSVSRLLETASDAADIAQYLRDIRRYPVVRDLEIILEHGKAVAGLQQKAASEERLRDKLSRLGS